ncbi:TPA: DUF2913 family protein [Serratia marcescens]|uniref:DUF2913 family protein n=2 Tax=Serratia TaxID=613 RepID=A0A9X9BZ89_9GAMM|nr:DUF2913 family protein [Serratia ureilytica]TXE26598.1 DUF2913 family protein [Serratia ureilytica]HBC7422564.1 DUF2913 family protein [Serratia marcescens]
MEKTHNTLPPEQTVSDLAHLAWCALMALRLAQQEGLALSPLTIHTFLVRWLADAQKQRRFPRSVATDIDSLLRLGRQKGPAAELLSRLQYLWHSFTKPVTQQSELFRLTHAIEHLRSQGWVNAVVTDDEWEPASLYAEYTGVSALLVRKSELQRHFTDKGQQSASVDFVVAGDGCVVGDVLDARALRYVIREQYVGWCILALLPSTEMTGDAKVPEEQRVAG